MYKLSLQSSVSIAAVALAMTAIEATPAAAAVVPTKPFYAGGATFPEKVYREIMNCYGSSSGSDLELGLPAGAPCTGLAGYDETRQGLYVGVGSGNGLRAWRDHSAQRYTEGNRTPDATPVASSSAFNPFFSASFGATWSRGVGNPFPFVSFSGSDDPITAADVTNAVSGYLVKATPNHYGKPIQVPALVGAVALPYLQSAVAGANWNEQGTQPAGASGKLDLSTDTLCGIWTGAITDWSSADITADNNGIPLVSVSAPITVYYRNESGGSGTTFLFSNALVHQCDSTTHPIPADWKNAQTTPGDGDLRFFINAGLSATPLPANFVGVSGSGGLQAAVLADDGSIGYVSTDFVKPYVSTGPKAANLQTFDSIAGAPDWIAATADSATAIMAGSTPPSFAAASCTKNTTYNPGTSTSGICAHNAVNWGKTNPTPSGSETYPIGGFSFFDMYTCYTTAHLPTLFAATGKQGFVKWYYNAGVGSRDAALSSAGFGPIPTNWQNAVKTLLFTNAKTKVSTPHKASTGCSAVPTGKGA